MSQIFPYRNFDPLLSPMKALDIPIFTLSMCRRFPTLPHNGAIILIGVVENPLAIKGRQYFLGSAVPCYTWEAAMQLEGGIKGIRGIIFGLLDLILMGYPRRRQISTITGGNLSGKAVSAN